MTRVAAHGGFILFVAVDAPLHFQRLLKIYDFLRRDIAMTTQTLDLGCRMRTVAEEDKTRQLVDQLQRDLPLSKVDVTALALRQSREARPIRPLGILVAECTLLLQRRVLLVIERPVFAPQTHAPQTQGKE
jgi:hypothetical protein